MLRTSKLLTSAVIQIHMKINFANFKKNAFTAIVDLPNM